MTKHGIAFSIAQAIPSQGSLDERIFSLSRDVNEGSKISINEIEKTPITRDDSTSRVAILRDREKDRSDSDYDRSYGRVSAWGLIVHSFRPPFVHYEVGFSQHGMLPRSQASLSYRSSTLNMSPFGTVGVNQISRNDVHSSVAPFYHQPLSLDYSQNY
ncbi:hypothetical protein IFM89_034544 [Coptis chinensis]|uniref:Uncharacterized protein n=1 Tax=Coptis chinensis TaxID=261450 RepID=A0A835HP54_9MAGN|nr:hypothetical protein IFM89_034544 [Coptis chinensis]